MRSLSENVLKLGDVCGDDDEDAFLNIDGESQLIVAFEISTDKNLTYSVALFNKFITYDELHKWSLEIIQEIKYSKAIYFENTLKKEI